MQAPDFHYTVFEYENLYRDVTSGNLIRDDIEQRLVLLLQRQSSKTKPPVFLEESLRVVDYDETVEREIDGDGLNSAIYSLVYACAAVSEGTSVSVINWWDDANDSAYLGMLCLTMLRVMTERKEVDAVYVWALLYVCEFSMFAPQYVTDAVLSLSTRESIHVLARQTLPAYAESLGHYITVAMQEAIAYTTAEVDAVHQLITACEQMRSEYLNTIFTPTSTPLNHEPPPTFDSETVSVYDGDEDEDGTVACCAPPLPGDYEVNIDMLSEYLHGTHVISSASFEEEEDDGDGDD